jgi:hypothetical protein
LQLSVALFLAIARATAVCRLIQFRMKNGGAISAMPITILSHILETKEGKTIKPIPERSAMTRCCFFPLHETTHADGSVQNTPK